MYKAILTSGAMIFALTAATAGADQPPQVARHELMENAGKAAKPIGQMFKEERPFDAGIALSSFQTWAEVAKTFGGLFPEGSETGYETEAKATIWSEREGFDAALAAFGEAVDAAIAAAPQDLESLKAAAGPVFKTCKGCHEEYRVEDEE
jgi:cytochrome c556